MKITIHITVIGGDFMNVIFNSLPIDGPLRITSPYGPRKTEISGASTFHHGNDLGRDFSKPQTNILAVAPGKVAYNGWHPYRGWYVVVQHNGFQTLYQHMKAKCTLPIGTTVAAGAVLGIMGCSADPKVLTVPIHLHFALMNDFSKPTENGRGYVDPEKYLKNIIKPTVQKEDEVIDKIKVVVNGETKQFTNINKNGTNFTAMRELVEALGHTVTYDANTNSIVITKKQ